MVNLTKISIVIYGLFIFLLVSCREAVRPDTIVSSHPSLFPDYTGVTIPANIAPLNFTLQEATQKVYAVLEGNKSGKVEVQGKSSIRIPDKKWKKLLAANPEGEIKVTVFVKQDNQWKEYHPFTIYISPYPIDYGLSYRLIAPGYEVYSKMGIYQRELSTFRQDAILENTLIPGSCVNCHSYKETDPGYMNLHLRGQHGGTVLQIDGNMDMLDFKTQGLISGVYPYWHPTGKYITYSVNITNQAFHAAAEERIEVVDLKSDVVVYDIENARILRTPLLQTEDFETFPAFSPDGKKLYFCLATKKELPMEYKDIKYNLCSIDFNPASGRFGEKIDTLVHAAAMEKSVSFPRPSYDGKYLMYTLSDYGNFSIWHREADLWLMDLATGDCRELTEVNSDNTESYHSWSSNSRWFVFSSRRNNGLYTQPYLASIDEDGNISKPFLLPQEDPAFYDATFYSFNIPEFISAPVKLDPREVEHKALSGKRKQMD